MRVPQPIPYQGSKRRIAGYILPFFPANVSTLIEPFAGSAAVSLAAARLQKARHFYLNDLNEPLVALWREIIERPEEIADRYESLWYDQQGRERAYYDLIRHAFNRDGRPEYLLYLLARCVKAAVRYNAQGEFNQSPDNRRRGRHPDAMREDIRMASNLLRGKVSLASRDYREVLASVTAEDVVYLDPPYQGVCTNRDRRYYESVAYNEFVGELESLTRRGVSFILSYDGRRGGKQYGRELPSALGLQKVEINAGRSTQSTLLGGSDVTYESLYLSEGLVTRLDDYEAVLGEVTIPDSVQLSLLA